MYYCVHLMLTPSSSAYHYRVLMAEMAEMEHEETKEQLYVISCIVYNDMNSLCDCVGVQQL